MTLTESWAAYQERIDALSLRERLLVLLTPLILIVALAFNQLSTQSQTLRRIDHQLSTGRQQIGEINAQIRLLSLQAQRPPPDDPELDALSRQLVAADAESAAINSPLHLIHQVLARHPGVRVQMLRVLPAVRLANSGQPPLYRHDLQLDLVGNYGAIIADLAALERAGPWYWQSFEDRITHYPDNQVRLDIFILDRHEGLNDAP